MSTDTLPKPGNAGQSLLALFCGGEAEAEKAREEIARRQRADRLRYRLAAEALTQPEDAPATRRELAELRDETVEALTALAGGEK